MIAAVRAKGFSPVDDNDADALALLDWAIANRLAEARGPELLEHAAGLVTRRRRVASRSEFRGGGDALVLDLRGPT